MSEFSQYLRFLDQCGKLPSMRDPIVVDILDLLRQQSTPSAGLTLAEVQAALPSYPPLDVEDRLETYSVSKRLFVKTDDGVSPALYSYDHSSAGFYAIRDKSIIIYFHPDSLFPYGGSWNVRCSPYKVNRHKGTTYAG